MGKYSSLSVEKLKEKLRLWSGVNKIITKEVKEELGLRDEKIVKVKVEPKIETVVVKKTTKKNK